METVTDPVPGPVLAAVRADLAALGDLAGGARRSFAAVAVGLAESFDDARAAGAGPSVIAKLAQELRATLQALTTKGTDDHDRLGQFLDEMGTPTDLPAEVGDAPDAEPPDAGPEDRGDSEGAG